MVYLKKYLKNHDIKSYFRIEAFVINITSILTFINIPDVVSDGPGIVSNSKSHRPHVRVQW